MVKSKFHHMGFDKNVKILIFHTLFSSGIVFGMPCMCLFEHCYTLPTICLLTGKFNIPEDSSSHLITNRIYWKNGDGTKVWSGTDHWARQYPSIEANSQMPTKVLNMDCI